MKIQTMPCKECKLPTPHAEEFNATYLPVWHCLYCGSEQRPPGGNSFVLAHGPRDSGDNSGGTLPNEIED